MHDESSFLFDSLFPIELALSAVVLVRDQRADKSRTDNKNYYSILSRVSYVTVKEALLFREDDCTGRGIRFPTSARDLSHSSKVTGSSQSPSNSGRLRRAEN